MRIHPCVCCVIVAVVTGCGPKAVPVEGIVTLDGQPVARATVTFQSEDGRHVFGGQTDENGRFSLSSGGTKGAYPGEYKVTVVKYPELGIQPVDPSQMAAGGKADDYVKMMKKFGDPSQGKPKGPMPPMPGKAGAAASGAKSELPEVYARTDTTPLRVTIPASGPIQLELHSKK